MRRSLVVLIGTCLLAIGLPLRAGAAPPASGSYPCGPSMAPSAQIAERELQASYATWKARYLTSAGAGGFLRVQSPEEYAGDTVSEGIGYGMLLAVSRNDRPTFDGLWRYAKSHLDPNGLMYWRINAGNVAVGLNSATDGDEDIAYALVAADKRWGGHNADARALIANILAYDIEPGTFVVRPTDDPSWGGSSTTNPSYFAPGYYKVFAAYTGDARWHQVADRAYAVLAAVSAASAGASRTGLQPDWTDAAGAPVPGRSYDYGYEATRLTWRLAMDGAWFCDARALAQLAKLNTFFSGVGAKNIRDGYRLDGTPTGPYHTAPFVGPAAAAAITSPNAAYRKAMWAEAVNTTYPVYYSDSLRLLSLLFISGNFPSP
jgi:endo-1,4-beta-D-glucanase Y